MDNRYVSIENYIKLLSVWFGIDIDYEPVNDKEINILHIHKDSDNRKIMLLHIEGSITKDKIRKKLMHRIVESNSDMAIVLSSVNDSKNIKYISMATIEDNLLRVISYPIGSNDYLLDKLLISKVKTGGFNKYISIKKLFSKEKVISDYAIAVYELRDFCEKYLDENKEEIVGKSDHLMTVFAVSVIQQIPIEQVFKKYILERLLKKDVNEIDIDKELLDKADKLLGKYFYLLEENDIENCVLAITPDVLGDVVQNIIDKDLKKANGVFYTPKQVVDYICRENIEYNLPQIGRAHV